MDGRGGGAGREGTRTLRWTLESDGYDGFNNVYVRL